MTSDLELLELALRRAYDGSNVARMLDSAIQKLEAIEDLPPPSPRVLCERLARALAAIPDDRLNVSVDGEPCGDPGEATGRVGPNAASGTPRPFAVRLIETRRGPVALIAILSFPRTEIGAWTDFITRTRRALSRATGGAIVDLRGNPGEARSTPWELARLLWGGDLPRAARAVAHRSSASLALELNSLRIRLGEAALRGDLPDEIRAEIEKKHELFQAARAAERRAEAEGTSPTGSKDDGARLRDHADGVAYDPAAAFDRPITLLVDRGCRGSCQAIVEALSRHPHLTTVGEDTGGLARLVDVGTIVLPRSHVRVELTTGAWRRIAGPDLDRTGHRPSRRVPSGWDALAAAIAEIEDTSDVASAALP